MNRTAGFTAALFLLATGCTTLPTEPPAESAQSLAESGRTGEWRLVPAWVGTLDASRRSGLYKTFAKTAPEERILLDGLKTADNETWIGYVRKSGLFRREVSRQCRLVKELPETERVWKCDMLSNLTTLLGTPTLPASKPWGDDRKCVSVGWRLFMFGDDGRIRILTVSAIVSRNAYETAWRVEGLILREGIAIPTGAPGTSMP